MIYVGIDPGQTNLALVAVNAKGEVLDKAKPKKLEIAGVQRLSYLMVFVKDFIDHLPTTKTEKVEMIALEGYSNFETFGREASGETGAAIKLALVGWYGLHDPLAYPTIVPPTSLKKFVTGKGNAKKDQMPLSVFKRWGFEDGDTNIVEAYGLAQVARAVCVDPLELSTSDREVVEKLRRNTEWSPNWDFKRLISNTAPRQSPSSKSVIAPPPPPSLESSPTRSTTVRKPSSGPSAPTPSTRRLKRASSPVSTPPVPVVSNSSSPRRSLKRRAR